MKAFKLNLNGNTSSHTTRKQVRRTIRKAGLSIKHLNTKEIPNAFGKGYTLIIAKS